MDPGLTTCYFMVAFKVPKALGSVELVFFRESRAGVRAAAAEQITTRRLTGRPSPS